MRWILKIRERLRLLRRPAAEERMEEEMRFHLEMQTEEYARQGHGPAEARRRAILDFGGVEGHKERMRDGRTLAWTGGLSLDARLGLRMMRKHPGLTLIGGLGMAVAVAIGAGVFGFLDAMMTPRLPLHEGDRVVVIRNATDAIAQPDARLLHDFVAWRDEVKTVRELGAFRDVERNLITGEGPPELVRVAEMTASGFRVARVPPLLGRPLVPADEAAGAPSVVVIGEALWRRRLGADPRIVGSTLQLGADRHTVVGVMPEGFAFPVFHGIWLPLRLDPSRSRRGEPPYLDVFGRLAPGVNLREARAELAAIGQRTAAAFPETHARLRPQVMPYAQAMAGADTPLVVWGFQLMKLLAGVLVVVVAVNVAILVYARTAMRLDEIAVRTALGATRWRVVTQLFVEALVLSAGAAVVGLVIAAVALEKVEGIVTRTGAVLPFWMNFGVTPGMVAYVAGLAVLGALIVGVGPGLEATGRRVQTHLQRISSGGSAVRLGGRWTALVITQVALAVAVLPSALFFAGRYVGYGTSDVGAGVERLLTATVDAEPAPPTAAGPEADARAYAARLTDRVTELKRRLEAEPGISAATLSDATPGEDWWSAIELEGAGTGSTRHRVGANAVDARFFEALDLRLLTGRRFDAGDFDAAAAPVVVNQSFVREVLGGGNALGRRIRPPNSGETGRWETIVGVVSDFPVNPVDPEVSRAKVYRPLRGPAPSMNVTVRVEGSPPAAFAGRLREITAAVDPTLRLEELQPLDEILREAQEGLRAAAVAITLVTLCVLLLSSAGIYALMSFAVTRRRREIGIRAALGAHPRLVLQSVFARAAGQLALGAGAGLLLAVALDRMTGGGIMAGRGALLLPAVAALIVAVGLLAAAGPARRALRIQPIEAIRGTG